MMRIELSLAQKGILLVTLPLACELIILITLAHLLTQSETELRRERHQKAVVTDANTLVNGFADAGQQLYLYEHSKQPLFLERYDTLEVDLRRQMRSLKLLLLDSANAHQSIERLERTGDRAFLLLGKHRALMRSGEALSVVRERQKQLVALSQQLLEDLKAFARELERTERLDPQKEARERLKIVQCMFGAVLVNVLLAIFLAFYFNRVAASRLKILVENSRRLAQGMALNPPIAGGDEIAHLDRVFHSMANDLAEAARRKQEMISMVSHDLRSPLTAIQGSLFLLQKQVLGPITERMESELARAGRSSTRLIGLINDLLDIEKLESGNFDLAKGDVSLDVVFRQSVDAVFGMAECESIKLDAPETQIKIFADGARLTQVVVNLLSNAIKFSPPYSTVRLIAVEEGKNLVVRVVDDGRGVPEEFRQSIFERFKQVDVSDAVEKKGTGLGLPICKLIIELHGGKIGVESAEGKGSTFWFSLPK